MTDAPRYLVVLAAVRDPLGRHGCRERSVPVRLRLALKHLLRCQGLKCVAVEEFGGQASRAMGNMKS